MATLTLENGDMECIMLNMEQDDIRPDLVDRMSEIVDTGLTLEEIDTFLSSPVWEEGRHLGRDVSSNLCTLDCTEEEREFILNYARESLGLDV